MALGKSANFKGLQVTVVSAGKGPDDLGGDPTYKVSVKYQNAGKSPIAFDDLDWQLEDAKGAMSQDVAVIRDNPPTLDAGNLAPGATTSGDIYLQPGDSVAKVVYQPASGAPYLATWKVK